MRPNLFDMTSSKAQAKRIESLAFDLKDVDTFNLSFSQRLVKHVEAIIKVPNRCKKGFIDGNDFSALFVDSLIQSGINPANIKTEVRCKKYVAEIDVLVLDKNFNAQAFHLKTSARERWRQAERDCVYFTNQFTNAMEMALGEEARLIKEPVRHYVVMVREYKETTPSQAVDFCRRKRGSYAFLSGFLSIYDQKELDEIVRSVSNPAALFA